MQVLNSPLNKIKLLAVCVCVLQVNAGGLFLFII